MNASLTRDSLCGGRDLRFSGIWAAGAAPSPRTIQVWASARLIPSHKLPSGCCFVVEEVAQEMRRRSWHWPNRIPIPIEIKSSNPILWRLVRLRDLNQIGVWCPNLMPCERTLRNLVRLGILPYYRVAGMLFFQPDEVRFCIVEHTAIHAAA